MEGRVVHGLLSAGRVEERMQYLLCGRVNVTDPETAVCFLVNRTNRLRASAASHKGNQTTSSVGFLYVLIDNNKTALL